MRSSILILVLAGLVRYGSAACANDCSGNGRCNAHSACECYRNWMSNDCSQRVCFFGRAFVDTPAGDLNSDGKVGAMSEVMAMTGNTPSHELFDETYALGDLEVGNFNEAHFYAECSGKGTCERESGLCECFTGYEGEGCTRVSCPTSTGETCSGHGVCLRLYDVEAAQNPSPWTYNSWDSLKTQQCNCDPLYTGIACDQRSCPSGDDPVTKYEHVTMLCGEWGLWSKVKEGVAGTEVGAANVAGKDPSMQINAKVFGEDLNVYGTVSGASAKLAFFCGSTSTDVSPRKLSTSDQHAAERACNLYLQESVCPTPACNWQAAVTRDTPEFGKEQCITVQGVNGLFTKSDDIVSGDSTYILNATARISHKYREELKQVNEVQTISVLGASCRMDTCVWNKDTAVCAPASAALLGFQSSAVAACGAASGDSNAPFVANKGETLCALITYNSGEVCTSRNPFALTFTNEYGSSFTTRTIECADYDSASFEAGAGNPDTDAADAIHAERSATAEHCRGLIESALEDLPNSALVDVDVRDKHIGSFNDPATDSVNNIITWSMAVPWLTTMTASGSVVPHHELDVTFVSNTGDVTMMTVIGQETEVVAIGDDIIHHSDFYVRPDVVVKEEIKGTTDNFVCSNRGVCDYSTGTCKCFQGFTRQDCSLQNVLAMY